MNIANRLRVCPGLRSGSWGLAALVACMLSAMACVQSLPISDSPCPCPSAFCCESSTNRCLPRGAGACAGNGPPDARSSSDGGDDGGNGPAARSARSFVVQGKVTQMMPSMSSDPIEVEFVLRIDPDRGLMILGETGLAMQVSATTKDGATFEAADPPRLSWKTQASRCSPPTTTGEFLHFSVTIEGDRLTGSADGFIDRGPLYAAAMPYAMAFTNPISMTMIGRPDDVAPTLGPAPANIDPLAELFLGTSEPLTLEPMMQGGAGTQLVEGNQAVWLYPVVTDVADVVTGFNVLAGALRYGTTYQLTTTPGWKDLAGNTSGALPTITTPEPPPLIAEDGFESGATKVGSPGVLIIDAKTFPPITGKHSVVLSPAFSSTRFTVRLAVSRTDTWVRFSVRPFAPANTVTSTYGVAFRAAVPGADLGSPIVTALLPGEEKVGTMITGPFGPPFLFGAVRTVELPLPEAALGEIVFDATVPGSDATVAGCGGMPAAATLPHALGYLIDDLRVE